MKMTIILVMTAVSFISADVNFYDYFYDKSLRMDYYHTGNKYSEEIIFDELIEEPFYGGHLSNLIDTLGYGNHYFKLFDIKSGKEIYSRGFSSLFQEWQFTEEAMHVKRSFNETIVFPYPKDSIRVVIFNHTEINEFEKIFEMEIDPVNYFIKKENRLKYHSKKIHYSGDHHRNLDIVFIPEGFKSEQLDDFISICDSLTKYLFQYSPFDKYKNNINTWAVFAPSPDSGADIPAENIWKQTILNSSFYTFNSERYLMTTDMKSVRDLAANVPYDQIYILVNTEKYGGGAVYNYYSLTSAKHQLTNKIFVHEFGHGLAGLADEYGYDSTYQEYYSSNTEPWEANITTLVDFNSKWESLVEPGTPIPTPFEQKYKTLIGAFEGAGNVKKGVYRSTYNSIMRSFTDESFNMISQMALERVLKFYTD